jgi:signal transduction histidine kinase/HAMP domain-containing protein
VRRRLRALVVGLLLLMLVVGGAGAFAVRAATADFTTLARGYAPAGDANRQAMVYLLSARHAVTSYLLDGDRSVLSEYAANAPQVLPSIEQVRQSLHTIAVSDLDGPIGTEAAAATSWLHDVAEPVIAGTVPTRSQDVSALDTTLFARVRAANEEVSARLTATRHALRARSLHRRDLAFLGMGLAALLALAVGTLYGLRTTRRLISPLAGLHETVRRLEAGDLAARANADDGPVEVRDVAGAVNGLGARVLAAQVASEQAERLRQDTQPLSESLRIGVDPYTMCQGLVVGLGAVFGVDRVWLHTFDDNRVPSLTVQWHAAELAAVPASLERDLLTLRSMANRLWHGPVALGLDDLTQRSAPEGYTDLATTLDTLGAGAALVVAVGDGASAMGLLVLCRADHPRGWTPTELSLANRIASELAHSLVQNNVVQRQHEVIAQLRALDEAKSTLVSTVSHELRTPLTSITGYLEMVLDGDTGPLPDGAADMLRVVERNTKRLRNLIEDLLTQSRIEAGRLRVTVTRVDLHDVLSEIAGSLRPLADANRVRLDAAVPAPGELCVDGDLRQLEQAITNLVANAIKFTGAGGQVCIGAAAEPDSVEVSVTDTGIGIPADELPHLFDRFFRASNATDAEIPGTGLGLSIVHEIVRAHQGELRVESQLGVGTTFRVRLPRVHAGAAAGGLLPS